MTDLRPWLRPTLLGPFLTTFAVTTLLHVVAGALVLPNGERFDAWLFALLFVGFFASAVVVALIAADVLLLRFRLRALPTHGRAWVSSLLAPIAIWIAWSIVGWGDAPTVPELVARIAAPIFAAPLALRYALGRRP